MIGQRICEQLISRGYRVRALSRQKHILGKNIELFNGNIINEEDVQAFIQGAHLFFHCAAELHDDSRMWEVNVKGTELLLKAVSQVSVRYFCYLSSAGVVGKCHGTWVDEDTQCNPQNRYEKSKYAAEKLVAEGITGCSTVILRPTNVIDDSRVGAIVYPIRSSLIDRIKVFFKGGECAHIVHAEDVADAALYFTNTHFEKPVHFFVSCDHERFNTFGGLWSLYKAIQQGRSIEGIDSAIHLPIIIPHILRRLWRGAGNYGNIRYSSEKLLSTGFRYRLGVEGAVRRIAASKRPMNT
jgi:nucleoside-diphosphate-sugar epimerase